MLSAVLYVSECQFVLFRVLGVRWVPTFRSVQRSVPAGNVSHYLHQRPNPTALFIERVGKDAGWQAVTEIGSTHCDHLDGGESTSHYGQQFETGQPRHIKVGE